MAGTTPKGFRFPQDSDAPNIAVDIENLADDVDAELDNYLTTTAGIAKSIVTAQGDLITASGSATPTRLAIGSADTYLKSDGTAVSWQPIVAGVYYINSTSGTPLAGTDLGIPDGEYLGEILTASRYAVVNDIEYNTNSKFLVSSLSDISLIGRSPSDNWTSRVSGFSGNDVFALTFGNNTFVAGGQAGNLSTSTDSITWTTRTSQFGTTNIRALTFGNNTFVAAGNDGTLRTSTDGTTWTTRTSTFGTTTINALTFGNNTFVAAGLSGQIRTSTDGTTWTTRTSEFGATEIKALTFGNNTFVAAGDSGTLRTSTDGTTWTTRDSGFGTSTIQALTFGNNIFVAGGLVGKISTSTDGITWTSRTSGFGTSTILALTFGSNIWIAAGTMTNISASTDGITWTIRSPGVSQVKRALTFGNDTFVLGGDSGAFATSVGTGIFIASFTPIAQTINIP